MFGRGKRLSHPCSSCGGALRTDDKVCTCGQPTPSMSFEERTRYEVERYRAMLERARTA